METYLIKRDEPMRPRKKERGRVASHGAPPSFLNMRNPSLILNAGLLASALTTLVDSNGTAAGGEGRKKKSKRVRNGNQGQVQRGNTLQTPTIPEDKSGSNSQIDLSTSEDPLNNVSKIQIYAQVFRNMKLFLSHLSLSKRHVMSKVKTTQWARILIR